MNIYTTCSDYKMKCFLKWLVLADEINARKFALLSNYLSQLPGRMQF